MSEDEFDALSLIRQCVTETLYSRLPNATATPAQRATWDQLSKSVLVLDRLTVERDAAKAELHDATDAVAQLIRERDEARREVAECDQVHGGVSQQLKAFKAERDALAAALQSARAEVERLREENDELFAVGKSASDMLADLNRDLLRITAERDAARTECERLRALAFEACGLSDDAAFPRKDCDDFMKHAERIRKQVRKK